MKKPLLLNVFRKQIEVKQIEGNEGGKKRKEKKVF
jgi:hypothetical protein